MKTKYKTIVTIVISIKSVNRKLIIILSKNEVIVSNIQRLFQSNMIVILLNMSSLVFILFFDQTSLSENQNDFSSKLGGSYIERVVKTIGQGCEKGTTPIRKE